MPIATSTSKLNHEKKNTQKQEQKHEDKLWLVSVEQTKLN